MGSVLSKQSSTQRRWKQSCKRLLALQVMERTHRHSCGVSLAIWDHTGLPSTRHKWTHPALTPARQAGINTRQTETVAHCPTCTQTALATRAFSICGCTHHMGRFTLNLFGCMTRCPPSSGTW